MACRRLATDPPAAAAAPVHMRQFDVRNGRKMFLAVSILAILTSAQLGLAFLLYQTATVFQLTSSISVAVVDLPSDRRVSFDWGFQMNYNLPTEVSTFYNVPIWPQALSKRAARRGFASNAEWMNIEQNITQLRYSHRQPPVHWSRRRRSDFTAGELYGGFEQLLLSYGFRAECLPRSVCELAQHPFAEEQSSLLTAVLTFLLTPSWHQGFEASSERRYKERYETAELHGFLGENCTQLYADCAESVLSVISRL